MEYGTGAEMVRRVRALAPALGERAARAEELRRLPDENVSDLAATGLFQALMPRRFGGAEGRFTDVADACRAVGAHCGSTGWVSVIYALHNWMLSLYPERAQAQVWDGRAYALVPCTLAPTGKAEPVEGGYRVTGRWSWGTGVMHADHVMVTALVVADDRIEPLICLLPRPDVTVHDVWNTAGMRGTGSNDIEIADAFVPEHRTASLISLSGGDSPGGALHGSPLYRTPLTPVFALMGSAAVLGIAEGVLARFTERMRTKVVAYSGEKQRDLMSGQVRLATASAELDAVRLLLADALLALDEPAGGEPDTALPGRARARMVAAHVVAVARRVVNDLCAAAGASAQLTDSPFQRAQRDMNTICGHVVFDPDISYALYGRVELGLGVGPLAMV